MTKFLRLYYIIINAFDILNSAVKWQLLFTFIKTFSVSLGDLHFLMTAVINKDWSVHQVLLTVSIAVVQIGSMFSVCASGDKLQKEVLRLRDMLACRLYQGKLDKQDRRTAQALLTLTETRNLSFSVFHMFNINISLPFEIVGLLVTYLIILLQFEKVNSDS
ncbi:unnamed protein product [Colias eurytheme]|nr:unnamed protein product [Colias eurytheme]